MVNPWRDFLGQDSLLFYPVSSIHYPVSSIEYLFQVKKTQSTDLDNELSL